MAKKRKKGRVGIVGLGIMGGAFAKNLSTGRMAVSPASTSIRRNGAKPRAAASRSRPMSPRSPHSVPVIITSLPTPQALHETARQIAKAKLPRRVIVETSTFAIDDKEKAERLLRDAGHVMLDCPISGTGAQAKTKDIVIYASGDRAAIRKLKPLCSRIFRARRTISAPSATAAG